MAPTDKKKIRKGKVEVTLVQIHVGCLQRKYVQPLLSM
jgi:hypothetical protein